MTGPAQNPPTLFPDLPREAPMVDKDGNLSYYWSLGFSTLFQALQANFKNEGIVFPNLSAANIANIQAQYASSIGTTLSPNLPDISGQTVFDTDNRVSKQFVITYDNSTPPKVLSAQWVILSYLILSTTTPNGTQAGQVGWLCYYTVGTNLWICTTSGSTTSAVWTMI